MSSFSSASRYVSYVLAILFAVSIFSSSALATERGGSTYGHGGEGVMAGALPPQQGLYYLNYLAYYTANRLNDRKGDKKPVDFDVDIVANASRFVYVTKYKLLGADYAVYVTIPLMHVDISAGGRDDSDDGLGDVCFSPFVLAWHSKNLHVMTGLHISTPTGDYDKKAMANVGRNYWTVEPVVAATYLSDQGFELSSKFMYDVNSENDDTDYKSGQEFHFDYAVAIHNAAWTYGLTGYFYKQTTDDELDGTDIGNRGQVLAVGPTVKCKHKNMSLEAKFQRELMVENRPEGNKLWLKLIWAF